MELIPVSLQGLIFVVLINGAYAIITVDRRLGTCNGPYCSTHDTFTNPTRKEIFCQIRNAKCVLTTLSCDICECKQEEDTFISYENGCLSKEKYDQIFLCGLQTKYNCLEVRSSLGRTSLLHLQLEQSPLYNPPMLQTRYRYSSCKITDAFIMNTKSSRFERSERARLDILYFLYNRMDYDYVIGSIRYYYSLQCMSWLEDDCKNLTFAGQVIRMRIDCYNNHYLTILQINFKQAGKSFLNVSTQIHPAKIPPQHDALVIDRGSREIFTNFVTKKREEFCGQLGADCYGDDCLSCYCLENKTFVSYHQGCLNESQTKTFLKDPGVVAPDLYTIDTDYLMFGSCLIINTKSLYNLPHSTSDLDCEVETFNTYNQFDGNETVSYEIPFRVKVSKLQKNKLCLQCKNFTCDLSRYSGLLTKMGIGCRMRTASKSIREAVLVKFTGKSFVNASLYIKREKNQNKVIVTSNKNSGSTTMSLDILIIVVVLSSSVVVIILVVLIIMKKRKENKKKQPHCAHYVMDNDSRKGSNVTLVTSEKQDTILYAQPELQVKEKELTIQKTDNIYYNGHIPNECTLKSKENMYYQCDEQIIQENTIYSEAVYAQNASFKDNSRHDQYKSSDNGMYGSPQHESDPNVIFIESDITSNENPIYGEDSPEDEETTNKTPRFSNNTYEIATYGICPENNVKYSSVEMQKANRNEYDEVGFTIS